MRRFARSRRVGRTLRPRRAMITVAVLVCLVVISLIGASLLRMAQSQRALIRSDEYAIQADWLAESGLERAAARLADDPSYRGETWSIPATDLGGSAPAAVTIAIEPRQDGPDLRLVTIQADYPSDADRRVRRSKRAILDLGDGPAGATP